jgi:hypothetical protein
MGSSLYVSATLIQRMGKIVIRYGDAWSLSPAWEEAVFGGKDKTTASRKITLDSAAHRVSAAREGASSLLCKWARLLGLAGC